MKIKRIYLEITNACNLNCSFCTNEKGTYFMSLNEIKDYVNKINHISDYLYLHVLGEPLFHPEFEEILNYFDSTSYSIQLVTNGTLLYKYPNILKHSCIRKLSVSIHSINNTDIDSHYFETINNLININENKCIELRFYNLKSLTGVVLNYHDYLVNTYNPTITDRINSYKLKDNIYLTYAEYFKWPNINDDEVPFTKCHGGIDQLAVLHNGDVTLCCLDPKGHNKIGTLKLNTLEEILNSELYKKYLNDISSGIYNMKLCSKCSYRLRFDDKYKIKQ